jgi:hypothetical protein
MASCGLSQTFCRVGEIDPEEGTALDIAITSPLCCCQAFTSNGMPCGAAAPFTHQFSTITGRQAK